MCVSHQGVAPCGTGPKIPCPPCSKEWERCLVREEACGSEGKHRTWSQALFNDAILFFSSEHTSCWRAKIRPWKKFWPWTYIISLNTGTNEVISYVYIFTCIVCSLFSSLCHCDVKGISCAHMVLLQGSVNVRHLGWQGEIMLSAGSTYKHLGKLPFPQIIFFLVACWIFC